MSNRCLYGQLMDGILEELPNTDNMVNIRSTPICRIIARPSGYLSTTVMAGKKTAKTADNQIAQNRKARHDYFIEDTIEAGLELQGWEVKSLRDGRAQLTEAYVNLKRGEAWLVGAHFSPLTSASSHVRTDPTRARKLLLHRNELDRLVGNVERKGYALVPLNLHWTRGRVKLDVGLARGKKQHDKRQAQKEHDWQRQKARILKSS